MDIIFNKIKEIIKDQKGIETVEVIGYALIGLVFIAIIYNKTFGGINGLSEGVGSKLNKINNNL